MRLIPRSVTVSRRPDEAQFSETLGWHGATATTGIAIPGAGGPQPRSERYLVDLATQHPRAPGLSSCPDKQGQTVIRFTIEASTDSWSHAPTVVPFALACARPSLVKEESDVEIQQLETFSWGPSRSESCRAKAGHQPEASLAWCLARGTAKRRQLVRRPCD